MAKRKLFITPLTNNNSNNSNSRVTRQIIPNRKGTMTVDRTGDYTPTGFEGSLPPNVQEFLIDKGIDVATKTVQQLWKIYKSFKFKRKGQPMTSRGYSLSKLPNPKPVSLVSGIKPNIYVSDYQQAVYNKCSPLHLTSCLINLPFDTENKLRAYFDNIISFDIQTKAQQNVSFNLNIGTEFTKENMYAAFSAVTYALQVYFSFSSILSYHSDPSNRNEGMLYLRNQIDAQAIERLSKLARRLLDTPYPPNMVKLIRFICGNYTTGSLPGAPMIKIVPWELLSTDGIVLDTIETAYQNISDAAYAEIFSLFRRSVPNWIIQLDDIPIKPQYSPMFSTIWANAPAAAYNNNSFTTPLFSLDYDTTADYNLFDNNLDGVAYACMGINYFDGSTNVALPGLMYPTVLFGESASTSRINRMSFGRSSSEVAGFYYPNSNPHLAFSRPETYPTSTTAYGFQTFSVHLPGADKVENVSINSILETTYNVMDWLMSLDTIRPNLQGRIKNK